MNSPGRRLTRETLAIAEQYLRRRDPRLGKWMERVQPVSLRRQNHHFGALCRTIIAQQLGAAASRTIHHRFLALFAPDRNPRPEAVLAVDHRRLRSCGLSGRKLDYLRALAHEFHDGRLRRARLGSCTDQKVRELLLPIPGIGLWTVEMFLIFSLGRLDVFSKGDLALRNAVQRVEGRSLTPAAIERVAERWTPYRSVASLYLWKIAHWKEPLDLDVSRHGSRDLTPAP